MSVCNTSRWKDSNTPGKKVPKKEQEPRNVRLGLAADGFNPFGNLSQSYSMWPVILTTYNLPPWLCMKESSFMLTLLIPGPKSPGKDIDVYLRPLIDDLKVLWAKPGVETIDVATGLKFNMRAMVLWTINDFPARSSLSGWSGQGYRACPTCNEDTPSVRVLGKTAYVGHRRFLKEATTMEECHLIPNVKSKTEFLLENFAADAIMTQLARLPTRVKEEALTFSSHYFRDVTMKFNRPDHNVACPPPTCQFQVFKSLCKSIGLRSVIRIDHQELKKVYVNFPKQRPERKFSPTASYGKQDDEIIVEVDPIPHDLADSMMKTQCQLMFARGYGGVWWSVMDRHPPYKVTQLHCGGCLGNRGKGTRKPNLGGRRAGRLHTCQETRNLGLKAITDKSGTSRLGARWGVAHASTLLGGNAAETKAGSWQRLGPSLTAVPTWIRPLGHKSRDGVLSTRALTVAVPQRRDVKLQGSRLQHHLRVCPTNEDEIMEFFAGVSSWGHIPVVWTGFAGGGNTRHGHSSTISKIALADIVRLKMREKRLTKQVNMFMRLFRSDDKFSQMLNQLESQPEYGGGNGSGRCGDDEPGDDEDGGEDEEDEDDS
ncbi:hypothetical protein Tco_0799199 [Tanacetum coccineum]